ncbi:MAG: hypothetical protein JXX29_24280 [Deltaproteobacteria bacterium]|nr:hypothetical protein [Deltaproteobacteria bacterium]MBN2674821.1 hypothetical protein [Deltaproteobacteria bacterium]
MFLKFKKSQKISTLTKDEVGIVSGKVVALKEVTIPGTEIHCACFWMMSEAWKTGARGRGRKMWVPGGTKLVSNGFFVEDDSGKVWVCDNADALDIRNGWEDSGLVGKKGTQRFVSRSIKNGDLVKIRGTVTGPKGAEPGDTLVIRPDAKGHISIIQKKKAK